MKKYMLFGEKRFVFDTAEQARDDFKSQTGKVEAGIETVIKAKQKSVKEATDSAQLYVRDISGKTTDRIARIFSLSQKDKLAWIEKINALKDAALKRIEGNRERYENIAAFAAVQAEIRNKLKKNEEAFRKLKGKRDLRYMNVLDIASQGLEYTRANVADMKADGVEEEKSKLETDIEAQIQAFQGEYANTLDYHKKQLDEAYQALVTADTRLRTIQDEDKRGTTPSGIPRGFSDAQARTAWLNLSYLKGLEADMAAVENNPDLKSRYEQAKTAAKSIEPMLKWWDEKYLRDPNSADNTKRREAWKMVGQLQANVEKAREKVQTLGARGASRKDQSAAEAAYINAKDAYDKNLARFDESIKNVQRGTGESEISDLPAMRYAREGQSDDAKALAMVEKAKADWEKKAKKGEEPEVPARPSPEAVASISPGGVVEMGEETISGRPAPAKKPGERVASARGKKGKGPKEATA